jgi:hypothetical protein
LEGGGVCRLGHGLDYPTTRVHVLHWFT